MRLRYSLGANFGDALNPLIFGALLPMHFRRREVYPGVDFVGIGSTLGTIGANVSRPTVIFSTGYAAGKPENYGHAPQVSSSWDVFCVRGPLTAQMLKLPQSLAITDGAALLRVLKLPTTPKLYKFSYMPHMSSEHLYANWKALCDEADVHYISPQTDAVLCVVEQIMATEVLLTEAMHGAIVADALRVPWVPVTANRTINIFKWRDWTSSVGLRYEPYALCSMYSEESLQAILPTKSPLLRVSAVRKIAGTTYSAFQSTVMRRQCLRTLARLKRAEPILSKDAMIQSRVDGLLEKLGVFADKYPIPESVSEPPKPSTGDHPERANPI